MFFKYIYIYITKRFIRGAEYLTEMRVSLVQIMGLNPLSRMEKKEKKQNPYPMLSFLISEVLLYTLTLVYHVQRNSLVQTLV